MKRVVTESDSRGFWETADSVCLTYGNRCLAAADAADELVRTKLEMGCAGRLSCADAFFGRLRTCDFFLRHGRVEADDAYKTALGRAQENPAVIEAIGSPISQTGIVSGNSNVNGATGELNLSIPLRGPKGKATLYVEAKKSADIWYFQTMVVKIEKTGERIDLNRLLLPSPQKPSSPSR